MLSTSLLIAQTGSKLLSRSTLMTRAKGTSRANQAAHAWAVERGQFALLQGGADPLFNVVWDPFGPDVGMLVQEPHRRFLVVQVFLLHEK